MNLLVDTITSTPSGLVLGVQVRGPQDAWLRFALIDIPWSSIPDYVMDDYWKWIDRDERLDQVDTPIPMDWA